MNFIPFELQFDVTPEQIGSTWQKERSALEASIQEIENQDAQSVTFESSFLAFEDSLTRLNRNISYLTFLKYVSADANLRKAADEVETEFAKLGVDIFSRAKLFQILSGVAKSVTPKDTRDQHLIQEHLSTFRRNGLELDEEKRNRYLTLRKSLVDIEAEFARNLVEWKDGFLVSDDELTGLPAHFTSSLERSPEGKLKLSLSYPHYFPFMEYAESDKARKSYEKKFFSRGGKRNVELMTQALQLRKEAARLLDYPDHASFVLEKKMAATPDAVKRFLGDLKSRLQSIGTANRRELALLREKRNGIPKEKPIESSEWRFYDTLQRKAQFELDSEAIKEFFPTEWVLKGIFNVLETLFEIQVRENPLLPVWHPEAKAFEIWQNGSSVAVFYTDLYPREGKYNHAAAFTLVSGCHTQDGNYIRPVSAIVANFTPPTQSRPSLLTHGEVETLFHELGHILHQVLTRAKHASFAGTSVLGDFVEAPSQMLEFWAWDPEILNRISGHYQDPKRKLPAAWIDKMIGAKLHNSGLVYLRQLFFALFDLSLHLEPVSSTTEFYAKLSEEILGFPVQTDTYPEASFGHLMGGYDAGYYGYLWSEVYAADLYSRFEAEGLLSPKTGTAYKKWILEPGGETNPAELIEGFLGRASKPDAFFKSLGMAKAAI